MYKIVLVDDERMAIKALAKSIEWEKFNFELCAVFTNGFDCLDFLSENEVDAVISDISMPQMDGIEMAKKINETNPLVKIVLASAYKNFDYALEAVRLKVFDYIVKPFEFKTMESLLQKLSEEISKEKSENKYNFIHTEENLRIRKLILDFIENKNRDFLDREIQVNGIDIRYVPAVMMNIQIQEFEDYLEKTWKYGIDGVYNAVNNIIGNENAIVFPLRYSFDNVSFILMSDNMNFDVFIRQIDSFRNRIVSECFEILNMGINVDILNIGTSIEEIATSQIRESIGVQIKMLMSIINERNTMGISENIGRFCSVFEKDEEIIRAYCLGILNELINIFGTEKLNQININYSDIFYTKNIFQLKEKTEQLCVSISNHNEYKDVYDAITAAKNYVIEHIGEGISGAEVAEVVDFSPSYFGRVFREKTGEKYIDFVNRVRIEAAQKYLANTGMKVNEIYEKVGYRSRNYFYNMFKNITGCSPQEYRTKIKNEK